MKIRAIEVGIGESSYYYKVGHPINQFDKKDVIITSIVEGQRPTDIGKTKYYQIYSEKGLEIDIWYPTEIWYDTEGKE